jgi:hypothetical protein
VGLHKQGIEIVVVIEDRTAGEAGLLGDGQ